MFVVGQLSAQDILVKKDGSIMTVYNLEESDNSYFYTLESSPEAKIEKINKTDVFSVKKDDGENSVQTNLPTPQNTSKTEIHDAVTAVLSSEIITEKNKKCFSAKTPDGHQLDYTVLSEENHTVAVVKGKYKEKRYVIPEYIEVNNVIYTVTEIGAHAFGHLSTWVEDIQFPSTLKKIGKKAFAGGNGLEKIILPEGLEEIEAEAFRLVSAKTIINEIYLPTSLKKIGSKCFLYCGRSKSPNGYCMAYFSNMPSFITVGNCEEFGIDDSVVEDYRSRKKN